MSKPCFRETLQSLFPDQARIPAQGMGGAVLSAAISLAARIVFPVDGGVFQEAIKRPLWTVAPRCCVNHVKR